MFGEHFAGILDEFEEENDDQEEGGNRSCGCVGCRTFDGMQLVSLEEAQGCRYRCWPHGQVQIVG